MNRATLYVFLVIILSASILSGQETPLTAEINNATHAENCEDGSIDLTITGGAAPYDVIWDFQPEDQNEPLVLDYHTEEGIDGNNDGEDIDPPAAPGTYFVIVTDALCGTAEASFTIECGCPECEIEATVTNENCSSENGSISTNLNCDSEGDINTIHLIFSQKQVNK